MSGNRFAAVEEFAQFSLDVAVDVAQGAGLLRFAEPDPVGVGEGEVDLHVQLAVAKDLELRSYQGTCASGLLAQVAGGEQGYV